MTKNDKTLEEIMEYAFQKQQEHIKKHPKRYAEYLKEQKEVERKERESMKLFPYRRRDIPEKIAKTIIEGKADDGSPMIVPEGEKEIRYALDAKRILILLLGIVGTGKTIAGCRWLVDQVGALYVKSREFCGYSEKMTVDRPFIQLYYKIPHLFLDELGTEEERDIPKIRELLQTRFDNGFKTLVAINATPKEAEELLGKRVSRRLFALGKQIAFRQILCKGEKRRQQIRGK